ncbi:hypothetical protein CY652_08875 [Burkholderia sp. WAC0059]|nr:hypothetical protein CY652_08875 [Burkholderia sp. WAC0059]
MQRAVRRVGRPELAACAISAIDAARKAIGNSALFVDANGAYAPKQAPRLAAGFAKNDIKGRSAQKR